ncbi:carbohydrate ABC transporter permease [Vallitalea guaymasensis]|uniref:Carbohydrate ABC transporter permease n=1 Tax=Vallitalea guaymasensis TaxID=1185412 RepID=A0A8J8MCC9_9FIRM|nr:carbohydrate ABC transporter permease [Vallitalea guaymasensis]QUH30297.1 carbohydrate ABC transporter permease [Vallitalea guaymasensis]
MKTINKLLNNSIAFLLAIVMGYPLLYVVSTSLKPLNDYFTEPVKLFSALSLENYKYVIDMGFHVFFKNSLLITFFSVIVTVLLATMASYALVKLDFKFNKILSLLFIAGMMIPVHATLIPIFNLEKNIYIYNRLIGVALPLIAFSLPISIFIVSQFMRDIPNELVEAAKMDGASEYQTFWGIFFPLLKPAISTIVIYTGVKIWNEFIFSLVLLNDVEKYTIPLGLQQFYGEFSVNVPALLAAIFTATIPVISIFLILQDKFVKSLTGGAVKG